MKKQVILIYAAVAVLSMAFIWFMRGVADSLPEQPQPLVTDAGKAEAGTFFPIARDLELVNQLGEEVALSDLRGKVWLVAQFFAVCPMCAERNGAELVKIRDTFKDEEDFHMVCITVDPGTDSVDRLRDYGAALGADPQRWWFASAGDEARTHDYLEQELKFFRIRERKDPVDIETHGRFAHDLGFLVVDRDWNVVGKWPLADARSDEARRRDPELYERLRAEMDAAIREALGKDATGPGGEAPQS